MPEENDISKIPPKTEFIPIVITQVICVAVILLGLVAVKYISPKGFEKAGSWCSQNILSETDLEKMFDGAKNEI